MGGGLTFGVLGPLAVLRDDAVVPVPGPRQRLLLARLLVDVGVVVPAGVLMDDVWGSNGAARGTGALRTTVWELRRLLGSPVGGRRGGREARAGDVLVSRDGGYLLDAGDDQVDSRCMETYLTEARAYVRSGRPERALRRLDQALGLCRGPAFGDLGRKAALRIEATRLDQLVLDARELRAELLLTIGRHDQVAEELASLARANPERERLWALLMTALSRAGRQAEAVRSYQEARRTLVETLGIEPGPELRRLERSIHDGDDAPRRRPDPPGALPLPHPATSFVGRHGERRAVAELLERSRVVTLAGPGGCGKTRLAIAVGEDVLPRFPGGVHFVDVSVISDADQVPGVVASAVEASIGHPRAPVPPHPGIPPADDEALLVLDNCEHLVAPVARCVALALEQNPSVRMLVTSREPLRLNAEAVWRVSGLSLPSDPPDGDGSPFRGSEAVELFVRRAAAALAGFAPRGHTLDLVARICRKLDGLPLAIELAASLVGSLPVEEIVQQLDHRLRISAGDGTSVTRHQSLQATLDWSLGLLDRTSRSLFARLGAFGGTFTVAAAEAVADDQTDPITLVQHLARLVRASMVEPVVGQAGVERYRMLETVRQYACDQLAKLPDADVVQRQHATYYCRLLADNEQHRRGSAPDVWLRGLVTELPNLRLALRWAMTHDDVDTGARLVGSLHWFLSRVATLEEVDGWLASALTRRAELSPPQQLRLLTAAGSVAYQRGDLSRLDQLTGEAIDLARRLDEPDELARSLLVRAATTLHAGRLADAEELIAEAETLCRRLGDRWGLGWSSSCRSLAAAAAGQDEEARRHQEEALAAFRRLHDVHNQVPPLVDLALQAIGRGQPDHALHRANEAVRLAYRSECRYVQHLALGALGVAESAVGHRARARALWLRTIRDFPDSLNVRMVVGALQGLAWLAAIAGRWQDALVVLGHAEHLRRRYRAPMATLARVLAPAMVASARDQLGARTVEEHLHRGESLDLGETVLLAEAATALMGDVTVGGDAPHQEPG